MCIWIHTIGRYRASYNLVLIPSANFIQELENSNLLYERVSWCYADVQLPYQG